MPVDQIANAETEFDRIYESPEHGMDFFICKFWTDLFRPNQCLFGGSNRMDPNGTSIRNAKTRWPSLFGSSFVEWNSHCRCGTQINRLWCECFFLATTYGHCLVTLFKRYFCSFFSREWRIDLILQHDLRQKRRVVNSWNIFAYVYYRTYATVIKTGENILETKFMN